MSDSPLACWSERDGALLRLRLSRPKANILDAGMIAALAAAIDGRLAEPALKAVLLDAEGPHFSFGASVEEHLPAHCAQMLASLHALLGDLVASPVPLLVAVRGQCLGGGLELACAGNLVFAAPDATLGQPEIKLAVFAPAASCLLPERVGRARAEDLLLSGRSVGAAEALSIGLVDFVDDDPEAAALAYFDQHLAPLSASSLRFALAAVRGDRAERVRARLAAVERLYLDQLMATHDAVEGLEAFVARRAPNWENR